MDQTTLKLIARFKRTAYKCGLPVDLVRFVADRNYARWALTQFTATAEEDDLLLALQIMDRLRLTAPIPTQARQRLAKAPLDEIGASAASAS